MPLVPDEVERAFRDAGALREGHFVLSSGRHSARYIEKFRLLERPSETERLCADIAAWASSLGVKTVAGPTTGGIILAHEVARQLGARAVYAERREDGRPGREFRRGIALARNEPVLVVDDVLTTGGSLRETIAAVRDAGGTVSGAAVLVDRSGGGVKLDVPLHALWRLEIATYAPAECPMCADGIPATHPGTSDPSGGTAASGTSRSGSTLAPSRMEVA